MLEKKLAADPSRFGHGAIEGVAAPESANNADAQCKFIPMLTLGLPASGVMALMLGALTIQGIQPGPEVMTQRPELFWGLIASMWMGNLMLVVLNLPMIALWVKLLQVPYRLLFPAIMAFSAIGIYSVNNSSFEIYLTALFGIFGFICMKLGFSPAPLLLGYVLGPMMEENLRRSMLMSGGDATVFVTRPISLADRADPRRNGAPCRAAAARDRRLTRGRHAAREFSEIAQRSPRANTEAMQIGAMHVEPTLGAIEFRIETLHQPPKPQRMIEFHQMADLVRGKVVEHE
jgi:hypothetical protein